MAGVGFAGCVTRDATSLASDERRARTGLGRGDAVALLVVAPQGSDASQVQARLERCFGKRLGEAPLRSAQDAAGLRAALGGTEGGAQALRQRADLLERERAVGVRYLLLASVDTREGGFPAGGAGGGPGWSIGRWEQRVTEMQVDVLDVKRAVASGRVTAKAYGPSGGGVFFFFNVLPIPLIEDAQTESSACEALGQKLARFLEDPPPHAWLPEIDAREP